MPPVPIAGHQTVLSFSIDLIVAAVLGGLIGLQRQASHKPAGFRTHLLVALGACAFMEISRLSGDSRIAANVITGVGFLGAGAIVREGNVPRGLTTAASIWASAAVGMALGFGSQLAYELDAVTTLLVFFALAFTDQSLRAFVPNREDVDVIVTFDLETLDCDGVLALFDRDGVTARSTDRLAIDSSAGRVATWHVHLRSKHRPPLLEVLAHVGQIPGIQRLDASPLSQP